MKWFIKCIRNYVNFNGRANRKEYWSFTLIVFYLIWYSRLYTVDWSGFYVLSSLFSLFVFLPSLSVSVHRMHDTSRSGKSLVWFCIAVFVWFVFFFGCLILALGNLSIYPLILLVFLGGTGVGLLVWYLIWSCPPGIRAKISMVPIPKRSKNRTCESIEYGYKRRISC